MRKRPQFKTQHRWLKPVEPTDCHPGTDFRQLRPEVDPGRTLTAAERAARAAELGLRARP